MVSSTLLMACSAHTAAKYSAVLSFVFWHMVCDENKDRGCFFSESGCVGQEGSFRGGEPTSSSSGSLVTLCMGRMRKEIMGRPPQSLLPSICFRVSLKAALLVLAEEQVRFVPLSHQRTRSGEYSRTHSSFCSVRCWKVSLEQ